MGPGTGGGPCWGPPVLEAAGPGACSLDAGVAVDVPDPGSRAEIVADTAARLLGQRA